MAAIAGTSRFSASRIVIVAMASFLLASSGAMFVLDPDSSFSSHAL
jgi:hypothetical protein